MNNLVLVDTSVFIEYLRGEADDSLAVLILNNKTLLSPIVKLELFAGVRKSELKVVQKLCGALRALDTFPDVIDCERLLTRAKGSGLFGGIPDLLILADVQRTKSVLFSYDSNMNKLATKLGIPLYG